MNTNDLFRKVASWEELSGEEKIEVAKSSIRKKTSWGVFEKMLSWEEVSIDEKLEIARDLVADNVANILQREMVVASLSGEETEIILKASQCTDSDENIRKFLTILGAKSIKVSSDFPCWRAWESYEGTTTIKFNY